jgi:glycosyltransferase involved in cell wall biosynthesis
VRVGINAEPMLRTVPTGVGVYTLALCQAFAESGRAGDIVLFHSARDEALPADVEALGMATGALPLDRDSLYRAWGAHRHPVPQAAVGSLDVVHAPGPAVPPPGKARLVATIHDLGFARHTPSTATRVHHEGVRHARREAVRIICPSSSTARDVVELLEIEPDRVRVVPHGVNLAPVEPAAADKVLAQLGVTRPYVFWVGTREPRKNLPAVLAAFAAMRRRDVQLVLAGPDRYLGDLDTSPNIAERITTTGPLPRPALAALYSRAAAFLYPSHYEGFGLPVLEAMAAGAPVVAANASSLPECAGDAGVLCDPDDREAMGGALDRLLDDAAHAEDLRQRGFERAKLFTWAATARRTYAVYAEAMAQ